MKRVITFGTFDLLHEGHLRILERAKALGTHLIVGVSSDRLNAEKGKRSFFDERHRLKCVEALRCVDEVFIEDSLERKDEYIRQHRADLLVMGDDWQGRFDWVSCEVQYLPRTTGVSTTEVKVGLGSHFRWHRALFADTYIKKHYECAMSLLNELTSNSVVPILTNEDALPVGIECDCLVYFNLPVNPPPHEYRDKPRVLIDHGASHLKWFLANARRYNFFDVILTAGPDHSRSLLTFFPDCQRAATKVRSTGFIKSKTLLDPPLRTREDVAAQCGLDPSQPIVLFAPTWHICNNRDMARAIEDVARIPNHVAILHPETDHLDVSALNVARNANGILNEVMKHADCVVSDLSSTIYEAAALGKKIVQVRLREYSDNSATLFDFPYTAGSAELFCGGIPAMPERVSGVVERLLEGHPDWEAALAAMRARILDGTRISMEAAGAVIEELKRACDRPLDRDSVAVVTEDYCLAHENLTFAQNLVVAHAGGDFDRHHASNSAEALRAALDVSDFVELDFVHGADGVLVAHDGFEPRYGLQKNFAEVRVAEFLGCRFGGMLHPLSVEEAIRACAERGKYLVCDIKSMGAQYIDVARHIVEVASELGASRHIVLQCYEPADFNAALRLGSRRNLLAVWKRFYLDPLGDGALAFVRDCLDVDASSVAGVTIPYSNKHMPLPSPQDPRILSWLAFWKRIYIHGAPTAKYNEVMSAGFGVFADRFDDEFEFRDAVPGFAWRQYLFLNPDVADAGHANPLGAQLHYLKYGRAQGRPLHYDVPEDFTQSAYVDTNPGLRESGICGDDSAKAHWTRYGRAEGRRYHR